MMKKTNKKDIKNLIIGIDLGTTNSLVSYIKDGSPRIIPNERGDRMTPSVVYFKSPEEIVVGQMAKNQAVINSEQTVSLAKLHMGTDKTYTIHDQTYTPVDVSAIILEYLARTARDYLGQAVTQAVITVPAYFNDRQRDDTVKAAEQAGLTVVRLLNEPTAAALVYGAGAGRDTQLLVIDLGGGTFDITLMDYKDKLFRVRGVGGSTAIGGTNFDQAVVNHIQNSFKTEHGIDLTADKIASQQLLIHGEKAKMDLSSAMETQVLIPYITVTQQGPIHLNHTLDRATFEGLIDPLLGQIENHIDQTFKDADLPPSWVDSVILVGGSTRVPALVDLVRRIIEHPGEKDDPMKKNINPDEAVARGAGILAGILSNRIQDIEFYDIIAHDLGVEDDTGTFIPVLAAGTAYPAEASSLFTTTQDHQSKVYIHILQQVGMTDNDPLSLGWFELSTDESKKKGETNIDVTFGIDLNGILKVSAMDIDTGKQKAVTINREKKENKANH